MKNTVLIALLALVALVVLFAFVMLVAHGILARVPLRKARWPAMTVVYVPAVGDYAQTGKPMDALYYRLLNDEGIETYKGFGVYYDDPSLVEKERCRAIVGCVLEERDAARASALREAGYAVATLGAHESTVASFPYRSPLSLMVAHLKAHPAIFAFRKAKGFTAPLTEVYDIKGKEIRYSLNDGADASVLAALFTGE